MSAEEARIKLLVCLMIRQSIKCDLKKVEKTELGKHSVLEFFLVGDDGQRYRFRLRMLTSALEKRQYIGKLIVFEIRKMFYSLHRPQHEQ